MKTLWRYINSKSWDPETKWRITIFINAIVWTLIPLLVCLMFGMLTGTIGAVWLKYTLIITGYSAMCIGAFGAAIYLLIKE
ncbi:MAG: hypothetical protein ACI4EF_04890 [Coprococcus sp.]